VALISDLDGRVLAGAWVARPIIKSSLASCGDSMSQAIRAAFADANVGAVQPRAVCLGLFRRGPARRLCPDPAWADEQMPGTPTLIVNDAMLVMAAGTPESWGVGDDQRHRLDCLWPHAGWRMTRAGGWGHLLGDEGSGFATGLAALRAVVRADDGRAAQTALTSLILDHWSVARLKAWSAGCTLSRLPRKTLRVGGAGRSGCVRGRCRGDGHLQQAGHELALAVDAVVRRLGLAGPIRAPQAGSMIVKGRNVPPDVSCIGQASLGSASTPGDVRV